MLLKKYTVKFVLCLVLSVFLIITYVGALDVLAGPDVETNDILSPSFDSSVDNSPYSMSYFADKFGISIESVNQLKTALLAAVDSYSSSFDLSPYSIDHVAFLENEYAFGNYISGFTFFHVKWGSVYYKSDGIATMLNIKYLVERDSYIELMNKCNSAAKKITDLLSSVDLSEVEKILYVHDWLCVNCSYNAGSENSFNICGPLIDGCGACDGYSKAFLFLLSKLGIKSWTVQSGQLNHGWNVVQLSDGKRYFVDVTWDDPTWSDSADHSFYASHKWFMLSYEKLLELGRTQTDFDHTDVDNKEYDDHPWRNITQPFLLLGGKLWFYDSSDNVVKTMKDGIIESAFPIVIPGSNKNISLATNDQKLYYSVDDSVFMRDREGNEHKLFSLTEKLGKRVYITTFFIRDGNACFNYYYFVDGKFTTDKYYIPFSEENFPEPVVIEPTDTETVTTTADVTQPTETEMLDYIPGDVDGNGKVDSTDYILVKRHILNINKLSGKAFLAADMDGNKKLDSTDYIIIKKIMLGLMK